MSGNEIVIRGARLHNLKNVSVSIPKNQFVVITGLSGSGKSTLALDTLYQEGARQFMESLGLVTDGLSRPLMENISGLSPTICVDQHPGNRSPRSTVGTSTEIFTYLRVLFARLGHRPCPACGEDVPPELSLGEGGLVEETDPDENSGRSCPRCGFVLPEISMTSFSFNKPAGACPTCTGLGMVSDVIFENCIDPSKSLAGDGVLIWDPFNAERLIITLQRAGQYYGFELDPYLPIGELGEIQKDLLYYGVNSDQFKRHFPGVKPPATVMKGYFEGVITNLRRRNLEGLTESGLKVKLDQLFSRHTCPDCQGTRLRAESRAVLVNGKSIIEVSRMALQKVAGWLSDLDGHLSEEERLVSEPIRQDLSSRLKRLIDIGVGYLTMERAYPSLSAGEGQRLRLAALLGSGLTGVTYILDEPTIGLHQRDTQRLIRVLRQLRDLGNTVVIIEHDLEMIRAADHVIEFGPGAGKLGGEVIATGKPAQIAAQTASPTGQYLSGRAHLPFRYARHDQSGSLDIYGAREHNLKNIDVSLPLGKLVAVTGVSGSGKSTLIFDILDPAARRHFDGKSGTVGACDRVEGWENLNRVVTVDQSPIGRIPRSNAATYTDLFTSIRETFAATPEARRKKFEPRHFSFNTPGGRCERCEGAGVLTVNMHFLPDVHVRCPACQGHRYKKEILGITYQGVNISEVLEMSIRDAQNVFEGVPGAASKLDLLVEVGLEYLQLGQPATTLSGGEAQRVKLAKELTRTGSGRALYLLDEPTTGLHMADVARLLTLLQKLVDAGNSVVVVEHHIELIRAADWVIDLGPEGGDEGGLVMACGTPEEVALVKASYTGNYLMR